MIGVIFHPAKLNRIIEGKEYQEHGHFYKNLAEENQIDLLFYSVNNIEGSSVTGYRYVYKEKKYQEYKTRIPKVNLIRTIISKKQFDLLQKIEQYYYVTFLNLVEYRDKYENNRYLSSLITTREAIPDTEKLSFHTLVYFLNKYSKVIIKPRNGSKGEGIYTIEKDQNSYTVQHTKSGMHFLTFVPCHKIYTFYQLYLKLNPSLHIQPYIHFRHFQGNKFDLRTSVQKNKYGKWRISGIVARVAANNGFVTNMAHGGRVVTFKEVESILPKELKAKIYELSLQIAKEMEVLYPASTDLGLDIAIDQSNKLWFIEVNYCDQRISYRESRDFDMWEASYRVPFEYAYAIYSYIMHGESILEKAEEHVFVS